MDDARSLCHTRWECKYHVVWIPKCRKKALYGNLRKYLRDVLRELARRRECETHEGHLCPEHVRVFMSIPPKYAVSQVIGFMKGRSAIHIARDYAGRRRNFRGHSFWGRGYYDSTVGRDEETIREYIRKQDAEDDRPEQPNLLG